MRPLQKCRELKSETLIIVITMVILGLPHSSEASLTIRLINFATDETYSYEY